ncbi:MAG: aspartyl protease family protein [Treponema sp.]|nr:aspartyl protease family protein [Treponema sp.]
MIDVKVGVEKPEKPYCSVQALAMVDTGADKSCITRELAEKLGILPSGTTTMGTATSIETVHYYSGIDLILVDVRDEEKVYRNLEVAECFRDHYGYDFIIGLNILQTGDMIISNANGITLFSFRTPSRKSLTGFSPFTGEIRDIDVPLLEHGKSCP